VSSHLQPEDVAEIFPADGPLIAYHYVQSGEVFAQIDGEPAVRVPAGSIVMFPRNDRHRLFTAPTERAIDSHVFVMAGADGGLPRFEIGEGGDEAEFFCGFLGVEHGDHPLLDCLPPMLLVDDVERAQEEWLESNLKFLTAGTRSPETVSRIAELLFAYAVRSYVDELPPGEGGWLRGLKDPAVARALRIIHQRFAEELEVESLAKEAGVSRSVLGDRFVELLGEPPMRYCAKWRMRVAANMLRAGTENSAAIAYAVGFNSEAAFNRAFKREYGEPPIAWKRRLVEEREAQDRRTVLREEPEVVLATARRTEHFGTCFSKDGTPIGYSVIGEGYPLVMPAVWFHEIQGDWSSPVWEHWLAEGVKTRSLIRSDIRGAGLSGRNPKRWTFEAVYEDFEAVVDALKLETFDILSFSHASLVAIAYAARNPGRVRKLILIDGYAQGYGVRGDPEEIRRRETLIEFARNYKGGEEGATTFAQMLGALYWPSARGVAVDWFGERLKVIMDLDEALLDVFRSTDLETEVPMIKAETLIIHSKGDRIIDCSCSERIAELLPDARFLPLDSDSHIMIRVEQAWEPARRALEAMLSIDGDEGEPAAAINRHWPHPTQEIRYCRASDGTGLAYSVTGEGRPIVKTANWLNHIEYDWDSPLWRHWIDEFTNGRSLVRYDERGNGLSDWDTPALSFDAFVQDLECVVDHLDLGRFDLLAISQGAAVAVAYAVRHPDRVGRLVICNGYAAGWGVRGDEVEVTRREAMLKLTEVGWGADDPAYRQLFTSHYIPDASREQMGWFNEMQRQSASPENAVRLQRVLSKIDVRPLLAQVEVPALVFHSRNDRAVPFSQGAELASGIPQAQFVPIESHNHILLADEPAWNSFSTITRRFLSEPD
jgi:pimeloyl-ACP methyl ester carboxylesterase/AraC-like DNA-binding protein